MTDQPPRDNLASLADLFPFGVASLPRLTSKALRGSVSLHSAVWRQTLIVFPRVKSESKEAPAELLPAVWLQVLAKSREDFATLSYEYPDKTTYFKREKNFPTVLSRLVRTLATLPDFLSASTTSRILSVLAFLVGPSESDDFADFMAYLAGQLYTQFAKESLQGSSPFAVLMSSEFVLHDLFSCLTTISRFVSPFFKPTTNFLTDVNAELGSFRPVESDQLAHIAPLYQRLFSQRCHDRATLLSVWTILFTRLRVRDLHVLVAAVVRNRQLAPQGDLPLLSHVPQLRDPRELPEPRKISELLTELIDFLDDGTDPRKREISMFQTREIMLCARQPMVQDEILPLSVMLTSVQ